MEYNDFLEGINHGTALFPLASYKWLGEFEYTVNLHWHKETEIIYFEKGKFSFFCNSNEYTIQAPAMAFIDAGIMHSLSLKRGQREYALVFDCRMLSYEWYDTSQSVIIEPLISQKSKLPPFIYPKDPVWKEALSLYKKTFDEAQKKTAPSNLRVKLYLTELLSILYENSCISSSEETGEPTTYRLENIKNAVLYVREHYSEQMQISDISEYIGMSEPYLCRCFKKIIGKTMTEYINEVRIEKASEMLRNSSEKVIDIAIRCGYDNIGYFIKRFKKIKGITPQAYRKTTSQP